MEERLELGTWNLEGESYRLSTVLQGDRLSLVPLHIDNFLTLANLSPTPSFLNRKKTPGSECAIILFVFLFPSCLLFVSRDPVFLLW